MNCQDHLYRHADPRQVTRRWFLEQCGVGLGAMALGQLLQQQGHAAESAAIAALNRMAPRAPQYAPKAKRVLFLFMAGAPSHLELFDNKPQLAKFDGTLPPAELIKGYRAAFIKPNSKLLGQNSSSPGTARAARNSPSSCRISRRWSTTSRSSRGWSPTRSTTRPARS